MVSLVLQVTNAVHRYLQGLWVHDTDPDASISRAGPRLLGKAPIQVSRHSRSNTQLPCLCLPSAVAVLSHSCWHQRVTGCKGPAHARCIDERPSRAKASGFAGKGS